MAKGTVCTSNLKQISPGTWACIPIYTDDSVFSTGVEIPATEDKIKKELAGHD